MTEEILVGTHRKGGSKALMAIVVVAAVAYGVFAIVKERQRVVPIVDEAAASIDVSSYQAVFLANGKSYFGKVSRPGSQYVSLSDVYYLVPKPVAAEPVMSEEDRKKLTSSEKKALAAELKKKEEEAQSGMSKDQVKPEYSLVKLGKEMYGPKDMMLINRDQIVMIENLSGDSQVVKMIQGATK